MVVWKDAHRRAAQSCAVDQRGVAEFVEDDDVVRSAQRAERAESGRVAARKCQRRLGSLKARNRILELRMWRKTSGDEARRAAADSVAIDCRLGRLL
jgi:hypothetical protein